MREMEDEYLTDGRDVVDGDLTDSDQEFQSIVEVDQLISQLKQDAENATFRDPQSTLVVQESIVMLCRKTHAIMNIVEFSNLELQQVFEEIVSREVLEITNYEWTTEIGKLAYEMEMPYRKLWAALINVVLLNHGEFSLTDSKRSLVDLLYYIMKANRTRAVSA